VPNEIGTKVQQRGAFFLRKIGLDKRRVVLRIKNHGRGGTGTMGVTSH